MTARRRSPRSMHGSPRCCPDRGDVGPGAARGAPGPRGTERRAPDRPGRADRRGAQLGRSASTSRRSPSRARSSWSSTTCSGRTRPPSTVLEQLADRSSRRAVPALCLRPSGAARASTPRGRPAARDALAAGARAARRDRDADAGRTAASGLADCRPVGRDRGRRAVGGQSALLRGVRPHARRRRIPPSRSTARERARAGPRPTCPSRSRSPRSSQRGSTAAAGREDRPAARERHRRAVRPRRPARPRRRGRRRAGGAGPQGLLRAGSRRPRGPVAPLQAPADSRRRRTDRCRSPIVPRCTTRSGLPLEAACRIARRVQRAPRRITRRSPIG